MTSSLVVYIQQDTRHWCRTQTKKAIRTALLSVYPNLQFTKNFCNPFIDLIIVPDVEEKEAFLKKQAHEELNPSTSIRTLQEFLTLVQNRK